MDYSKLLYNLNYAKETGNGAGLDIAIKMIKEEIYKTEAKNAGRSSALSAAKKILNNNFSSDDKFCYPTYNNEGEQYICNGYALVKLNKALPLENRPNTVPPMEASTYDKTIKAFAANNLTEIDLPPLSELKANLKIQKGKPKDKKGYVYDFGAGLPMVNIEYLIYVLSLLPNCKKAKISASNSVLSSLYFYDNNGVGILMPIKKI